MKLAIESFSPERANVEEHLRGKIAVDPASRFGRTEVVEILFCSREIRARKIDAVDHEIGVSETTAELVPGRDADYFTAVARIKHQNGRRMMGRLHHCLRKAEPVEYRKNIGTELDAVPDGAELWCLLQYAHGMPALSERESGCQTSETPA